MRSRTLAITALLLLPFPRIAEARAQEAPPGDTAAEEAETEATAPDVPESREQALELPLEVLKARLRPLRKEQVAEQLEQWLALLQRTCLEVSDAEVATLQAEEPQEVERLAALGTTLRGERAGLIKRVSAVIEILERKGGDVEESRSYVESVETKPPIVGVRAAWATARAWLVDPAGGLQMGKSLLSAIGILIGFWFLASILSRFARRAARSLPHASELLREFITSTTRRVTLLIGFLIAFSTLGVNMTPLVAAIGAAGLVIGLALQGTLGNLASGLMIMVYRPFDVDHVVSMAGVNGKVTGMTLMTTSVRTFDNQMIHVPNNKVWGDVITNVTANPTRRVDMTFGISYSDDITKAKQILEQVLSEQEQILADPAPIIRLHQLGDSSVNFIVRPWAKTPEYWDVYWSVTENVKRAFDREDITIPFPQRDLHIIGEQP